VQPEDLQTVKPWKLLEMLVGDLESPRDAMEDADFVTDCESWLMHQPGLSAAFKNLEVNITRGEVRVAGGKHLSRGLEVEDS
jgi:hypothetical protein